MFPSGFVMEDMGLISTFFKGAVCQIYQLSITREEYFKLKRELKKYCANQNQFHYNIKGLVHIKFNRIYHRDHHFLCSQFVGKIIQDTGIYDFKKDYSLLRPKDIIEMPNLIKLYEGKILDYLEML